MPEQQDAHEGGGVCQVMDVPIGEILMRLLVVAEKCVEAHF